MIYLVRVFHSIYCCIFFLAVLRLSLSQKGDCELGSRIRTVNSGRIPGVNTAIPGVNTVEIGKRLGFTCKSFIQPNCVEDCVWSRTCRESGLFPGDTFVAGIRTGEKTTRVKCCTLRSMQLGICRRIQVFDEIDSLELGRELNLKNPIIRDILAREGLEPRKLFSVEICTFLRANLRCAIGKVILSRSITEKSRHSVRSISPAISQSKNLRPPTPDEILRAHGIPLRPPKQLKPVQPLIASSSRASSSRFGPIFRGSTPDEKLFACCQGSPGIPTSCYNLCNFRNLNTDQLIQTYQAATCPSSAVGPYLTCATGYADHTACCTRAGLHRFNHGLCMKFCNPLGLGLPQPSIRTLACLRKLDEIKQCFISHFNSI